MNIRWGKLVNDPSEAAVAATEGFDFVQPAGSLVADMSAGRREAEKSRIASGGLPFTACAVPLPPDARVTERGFNLYAWTEYLKEMTRLMAGLGCRKLLWSGGRARVLPVEGGVSDLKEQLMQFLFMLCEVAESFGITVLIEPLGMRRTNYLNTMTEIGDLLERVGKDNLSSMISLRELEQINLPIAMLGEYRSVIRYVQMENPKAQEGPRLCPRPSDGFDYLPFLRALKNIGYDGEVGLPADADSDGLAFCRGQWDRA